MLYLHEEEAQVVDSANCRLVCRIELLKIFSWLNPVAVEATGFHEHVESHGETLSTSFQGSESPLAVSEKVVLPSVAHG